VTAKLLPLLTLAVACGGSQPTTFRSGSTASTQAASAPAPADVAEGRQRVPLDYAPARGARDAAVTIVTFTDFECPFCRRAVPTLERLREAYPGQVRVVLRQFPLAMHPHAKLAAAISLEAYAQGGDELFWRVHDRLFALEEEMDRELLLHLAEQVGVDRSRLEQALAEGRHDGAIAADIALAEAVGVSGTPTFFVNGRPLAGALPYERFAALVEEEIALADQLVASGVAPTDVYTALTWGGRAQIPTEAPPAAPAAEARGAVEEAPVFRVPIIGRPPTRGPDDALVTIVMFSDFQCPFCSRVEPTLNEVVERYGSDVRIVWMNNPLPFHQDAKPAAEAALEIYRQQGDQAFWQFHDRLFENQRALSRADLERYAQALGADMTAFGRALDTHQHEQTIEAQQELATRLGARGTPNFFINGRQLQGAQPLARFVEAIDAARAEARELLADGVDRSALYERIIRDGRTEAAPRPSAAAREREREDPNRIYELPIPADAPRQGSRQAQVVIQEMADLQCPFCSRVQATLERVRQEYGSRVQIVYRDYPLPFHQDAALAAEAAREVKRQRGDRAFFRYIDILFSNQRELGLEKLVEYAGRVRGVNRRRLRRALEQRTHQAAVEAEMEAIRGVMGSIGTPTFLINGKKLVGAQPFEAFRDAVDEALQAGNTP
jgi:protein-disulfide isomerase